MSEILVQTDNIHPRPALLRDRCPLVVIYVSTDMRLVLMCGEEAQIYSRDLKQQDADRLRLYRRLDLVYYVWLCAQMRTAEQAHAAGRITDVALATAQQRLALCATWIEQQFTAQQIAVANHAGVTTYHPPVLPRIAA